jgi:hypothetical protein
MQLKPELRDGVMAFTIKKNRIGINYKTQPIARRFRAGVRLLIWSWYWIPMCFVYFVLQGISWLGDKAYDGAEWINSHPPPWDTANKTKLRGKL